MKRTLPIFILLLLLSPLNAIAGLDDFLSSVNIQARADMPGFSAKIGAQFGSSNTQVQAVIKSVHEPADAFMIFQLAQFSGKQPERVMEVYSRKKGKGWGNIAKDLGIKPGSAEFHALKNGDLHFTGNPSSNDEPDGKGKGKGKGRGKGHNK